MDAPVHAATPADSITRRIDLIRMSKAYKLLSYLAAATNPVYSRSACGTALPVNCLTQDARPGVT